MFAFCHKTHDFDTVQYKDGDPRPTSFKSRVCDVEVDGTVFHLTRAVFFLFPLLNSKAPVV